MTMKNRSGFTFMEVLIAMLIISILSGVVGLSLYQYLRRAKLEAARAQIKTFQTALQMYRADQGRTPAQGQGLEALCEAPTAEPVPKNYPPEGYLDSRILPKDPWGNAYIYLTPGRDGEPYEVISYGSDGEEGGSGEAADITSSAL
jgi:general secretion pathway protein G